MDLFTPAIHCDRNWEKIKNFIACHIRHLLEQKFRIILNIVLIVNEFEFVFFPQHQFFSFLCCFLALLLRSTFANVLVRLFLLLSAVVVIVVTRHLNAACDDEEKKNIQLCAEKERLLNGNSARTHTQMESKRVKAQY